MVYTPSFTRLRTPRRAAAPRRLLVGLLACCALLAGCSRGPRLQIDEWPASLPQPAPYRIVAGDVVDIKFVYSPEFNETQVVRTDGKLSLLVANEVQAEGRTPEELRQYLLTQYEKELKNPVIGVSVKESAAARQVYVCGEVKQAGLQLLRGRTTVLEAIAQAGGFNNISARPARVVVLRQVDGRMYAKRLDLSKAFASGVGENPELANRDIVFVSRSRIDRANQWIEQNVNKLLPDGLRYMYQYSPRIDAGYAKN